MLLQSLLSEALDGVGWRWGAVLSRPAIPTKCREVCLPDSSLLVQCLELFIRPSTAEHMRGREGPEDSIVSALHTPCHLPTSNTTTAISLLAFHPQALLSSRSPRLEETWPLRKRCAQRSSLGPAALHGPLPRHSPTPLTGWGWRAIAAHWKLVLESGQSAWGGESTQHGGEEEGVGGHRVPIEVPSPRCWAGAAVAGHARRPQSEAQADSLASFRPPLLGAWGLGPEGARVVSPPPLLSRSCSPRPAG